MGAASFFGAEVRSRKKDIADSPVPFNVNGVFIENFVTGHAQIKAKICFFIDLD
jgi:hypothetical protein